jgi:hypothetical protein
MVGLLAIWGYATIREHAMGVAREAADAAANEAADRVLKEWISDRKSDAIGQDLSDGYKREEG